MEKRLDWIDVLNLQTRWIAHDGMETWFNRLVGRPTTLPDGSRESLMEAFGFMRRSVANLHFGEPVDLLWLDMQLRTVSLGLMHFQGSQPGINTLLPTFRARIKGMRDADLLRVVKETLLIQFATYIGDHLDGNSSGEVIRCHGWYRTGGRMECNDEACLPEEMESKYLHELPVPLDQADDGGIVRCATLFTNLDDVLYCSDVCRFATLQIAKDDQRSVGVAEKPRRYRARRKRAEQRETTGRSSE